MTEPDSLPEWPLRPTALFLLFLATFILAVTLFGESEAREDLGYLLILVVGPFVGALIWARVERHGPDAWKTRARRVVLLAAPTLLLISLGGIVHQKGDQIYEFTNRINTITGRGYRLPLDLQLTWLLPTVLVISALILADRLPGRIDRLLRRYDRWTVPLFLGGTLLFCAIYSPLYRTNDYRISAFIGWIIETPLYPVLLLIIWPLAYLLPRLPEVRRGALARILLALALVYALLLYDDQSFIEWAHYTAYVGPALHALNGGTPMVDVYSQYGILPWAVLWISYHWMPETYGAAAMVIRVFTALWYLTLPLTVYRLTENKLLSLLLSAAGLLWIIGFPAGALNDNALPSTQGYRYLLPMLGIAWLAWVPPGRLRSIGVFLLMVVGSLWSVETATFIAGPALALALLVSIRDRRVAPFVRETLLVVGGVLVGHAALALYLKTTYGQWPDYRPFLEMFGFFVPTKHSHWSKLLARGFGLWIPFAGILFAALAIPVRDALAGEIRHPRAWRLVPATVLAIGELSYFVGRSHTTPLGLALMPFLIVAIVGFEALLERWRGRPSPVMRAERVLVALAMAGCLAIPVEVFVSPYNPATGNATILRHCFTSAGCAPGTVVRRIADAMRERAADLDLADPKNATVAKNTFLARVREAERLIKAHAADQKRIGLLIDTQSYSFIGIPAMADLHKWFEWPISSPINDAESPTLVHRILASAKPHDGEILFIAKARERLAPIIKPLAQKYAAHCTLKKIDGGEFFDVVRTTNCHN